MTREQDKHYKVRTTYIDYYVTKEDVEETVLDDLDELERESMSEDELDEIIEQAIETTRSGLPQELELEITCEPEDLEDMIVDAISEEVGWLVNYFEYVIIEE
jgi:hypothetical protein